MMLFASVPQAGKAWAAETSSALNVSDVIAGRRTDANVVWWGFDPLDSTRFLQEAIDSGARKILVPYTGEDWVIRPIKLRSDLELVLEPGVVLLAKKREFKGRGDSLMQAADATDITLRGYGATLRMRKEDYTTDEYEPAEWRMALDFAGCRRVRIEGLHLKSSGGDGIYLGSTKDTPFCEDVLIRDVVSHDNHRQGVSVISASRLTIENCVFSATGGTAPQAGLDFEPNSPGERLEHCVVRNCRMENNAGAGILVYLNKFTRDTRPVSIRFEHCYIKGGKDAGIGVGAIHDNGPQGLVEFVGCVVEDTDKAGLFIYDKSADSARVRFVGCKWRHTGLATHDKPQKADGADAPLLISQLKPERTRRLGAIDFQDCRVYDPLKRPALAIEIEDNDSIATDIQGDITVRNPFGANIQLPQRTGNINLRVIQDSADNPKP